MSSFLSNIMRMGQDSWNARAVLISNAVTIRPYINASYSVMDPLLIRFSSTNTSNVSSGAPTHDFSTASWGLPADDGLWDIHVGLQYVSASSIQVVFGLSRESGSVTSLLNASATDPRCHVVGPASVTGEIVWVATIHNVLRTAGTWSTALAFVEEN